MLCWRVAFNRREHVVKLFETRICAVVTLVYLSGCSAELEETPEVGLPNPASVFCAEQGGSPELDQTSDGVVGYCRFPDGTVVNQWEYYRANH